LIKKEIQIWLKLADYPKKADPYYIFELSTQHQVIYTYLLINNCVKHKHYSNYWGCFYVYYISSVEIVANA